MCQIHGTAREIAENCKNSQIEVLRLDFIEVGTGAKFVEREGGDGGYGCENL